MNIVICQNVKLCTSLDERFSVRRCCTNVPVVYIMDGTIHIWFCCLGFGMCVCTIHPIRLWNSHSAFAQISISAKCNSSISAGINVAVDTTSTTFVCALRIKTFRLSLERLLQFFRTSTFGSAQQSIHGPLRDIFFMHVSCTWPTFSSVAISSLVWD